MPHEAGFGFPLAMSPGIAERGKNQMEIALLVHSVAYTPPPLLLNPLPYDCVEVEWIPQPAFVACPGALMSQLLVVIVPEKPPLLTEQPAAVCRVMSLEPWSLTPSIMSISPLFGQFAPTVQLFGISLVATSVGIRVLLTRRARFHRYRLAYAPGRR